MAKKCKHKKSNKKKKKNITPWVVGLFLLVIAAVIISGKVPFSETEEIKGKSFYVRGGETRPVLDPSMFTGLTRVAYAAAREHARVMDQVYCYCYCDSEPFNHKSLLSCFTERHGAG